MDTDTAQEEKLLATLKARVIADLDTLPRLEIIPHIIQTAASIEGHLRCVLRDEIGICSPTVIPGAEYHVQTGEIRIGGCAYQARVGEDTRDSTILEVALVGTENTAASKWKTKRFLLPGHGRYRKAVMYLPSGVPVNCDFFAAITEAIFATGYFWLEERFRSVLSHPEVSIGVDLYSYLRPIVASDDLLNSLWFGCAIKGHGVYLLDPTVAMAALDIVSPRLPKARSGELQLVAEFLGCDIPAEKTFGTIATQADQCLDFNLQNAQYKEDLPLLVQVQIKIYGEAAISVFPIVSNRAGYLSASFPASKKGDLLPVLAQHRQELARRYVESGRTLKRLTELICGPKRRLDLVSLLGRFTGACMKEYSREP